MSPFSMQTTPLHHPDEDLTNFHQQNQTNVYHNPMNPMMNPPKQMAHSYAPSLMMPQPPTPVSTFNSSLVRLTIFLNSSKVISYQWHQQQLQYRICQKFIRRKSTPARWCLKDQWLRWHRWHLLIAQFYLNCRTSYLLSILTVNWTWRKLRSMPEMPSTIRNVSPPLSCEFGSREQPP